MRFADTLGRGLTLAALCAALAGCASLGNPFNLDVVTALCV